MHATGLAPYYEHLCTELGWTPDQAKLTEMQGANLKQLEELDAKIKACTCIFGARHLPAGQLQMLALLHMRSHSAGQYNSQRSQWPGSGWLCAALWLRPDMNRSQPHVAASALCSWQ